MPLVSVELLAPWELREPLVRLETLVVLVHLDPRWVLWNVSFQGRASRDGSDVYIDLIFLD